MAALATYSGCAVSINNNLLTQESSVSIDKKSGLIPVFTSALGLAGMAQGAAMVEISVDNAVPLAGFELNPDAFMLTAQVVEIEIVMAGQVSIHKGYVTDATYSHSVNDAGKLAFKFTGQFSNFEDI